MKKFLLMAAAALISVSAMAIDKVQKKTTTTEITSVEELASSTFQLTNTEGQVMCTPSGWDIKVIASAEFTGNDQGGYYKLEAYNGHWLIPVYQNADGTTRRTFWAGNQYVNSQPAGGNVIFGLSGTNDQHGQDGKDLAVWDITYSEGNGFAFHCVGRDIYIGYDASAARPVDNIVYWTATGKVAQYDAAEVANAYNEVKGLNMQASVKTALEAAKSAYDTAPSFDKLTTYGDAVNAAIVSSEKYAVSVGGDLTSILVNPHFNTSDLSAWNMNGKASPTVTVDPTHNCEFYEKDFNMSMTIHGMKKGTYEIGMQAFQRPAGANAGAAQAYENGTNTSIAQLYTTAMETEVPDIMAEKSETSIYGDGSGGWPNDSKFDYNGTTYYVPNSVAGANAWFALGHYKTTAKAVVTEDGGDLTFGFKGKSVGGGWILFDNFTLTYISEDVLVDAAESEKLIAKAPTAKMGTAAKTALDAAVAALEADKTNGSLYNELKDAVAVAEASVAYYAVVAPYVELYDNFSEAAKAVVTAPAPSIIADYKSGSLNEAGFADVNAMVRDWLIPGLRAGVKVAPAAGDDLTVLIENPSFETGNRNGWTDNSAANMWTMMTRANAGDPKVGNYWIEKYGVAGKIDLSQTLTGMPGGTYRLSVVALDQADVTKLVANDQEAAITGGSASTFSVDVVVPANGELKLGIYCESHPGNKWVGLDDFHLTYVAPLPIEAELSGIQIQDLSAIGSDGSIVVGYDVEGNEFTFVFDGDGNYDSAYLYTVNDEDCYASKGTATFALTEEGKALEATVTFTDGADFEETYHVTGLVAFDKATMAVSAEAKYGTFVAPFDVTIPADVTAYVVEDVDEVSLVLTDITEMGVDYIPAYTPVVLNAEAGLNETAKGFTVPIDEDTPIEFGLLTGVLKDTPAPVGSYVLQNQAAGVGFYKVEGVQPTVKANRAYLNASSAVKAFTMGEATAIKTLEALTAGKAEIFDLNGRQINKLQKGINIVNGVKVLVK